MFKEKGFTLVELLVVIVIIAILAVAVLAAINPIEQIRRARDTARQTAAKEYLTACERYYGVHEWYPWDDPAYTGTADPAAGAVVIGSAWADIGAPLITAKELKPGFARQSPIARNELTVVEDTDADLHVCFIPEATAFLDKADCSTVGVTTTCDGVHAPGDFFCVPDSAR